MNKDLDLPTQRQLLAQFRCDEIAAEVFASFVAATQSWREQIDGHALIADFGEKGSQLRTGCLG